MRSIHEGHLAPHEAAECVQTAGFAPSILNTQPWRFRIHRDRIEVHTDPARRLRTVDPAGRQHTLSCGAAILNLRLALANVGFQARTELLPDLDDRGHLATLVCGERRAPSGESRHLHEQIWRRRTHRHGFLRVRLRRSALVAMRAAAQAEGAGVVEPPEDLREECARLVLRATGMTFADPAYMAEVAEWTRSTDRPDGIPLGALGGDPSVGMPRPYHVPPTVTPDRESDLARWMEPLVLETPGDGQHDWLRAGQAMQRMLLCATGEGATVSIFSQVVEVGTIRDRVAELLATTGRPQVVLRVGYPAEPPAGTPRRAASDLVW